MEPSGVWTVSVVVSVMGPVSAPAAARTLAKKFVVLATGAAFASDRRRES